MAEQKKKKKKLKPTVNVGTEEFPRDPGFLDRLKEGFLTSETKGKLAERRKRARKRAGLKDQKKKGFGE